MTNVRFSICLSRTLNHEGGYVNHPRDPGGATNFGITQRTYDSWRVAQVKITRPVKHINKDEVQDIYKQYYWSAVKGDHLPAGLDYVVFDAAVNSGVQQSTKWLQTALGVRVDGMIGPVTLTAAAQADTADVILKCIALRQTFLKGLPHWNTFKNGWTRRVASVEAGALRDAAALDRLKQRAQGETAGVAGYAVTGIVGAITSAVALVRTPEVLPWVLGALVVVVVLGAVAALKWDRAKALLAEYGKDEK